MRFLVAALVCFACTAPAPKRPPGDDPSAAVVDEKSLVLRTGAVGASDPVAASYALVEVANRSEVDRLVTVGGTLLDAAGAEAGALAPSEMRVPKGQRRVYALVADKPVPAARGARVQVMNAVPADYPSPVALSGEKVAHGDLTVATAMATNVIEREVSAVIAAAFYDEAGRILSRPFTVIAMGPGQSRPLRFEGPREAARAVVFVGQIAFH